MSKTTAPSKKEVVDAIISYSPDRLQHLIDLGYDLNLPLLGDEDEIKTYDLSQKIDAGLKEQIALDIRQGAVTMAFPLHVAVVSLYHAAKRGRTLNEYGIKQALKTFKILLANGALWCMGCGDIIVLNPKGYNFGHFSEDYPQNQALHLAMFLKKYEDCDSNEYMDVVIRLLQEASKKNVQPSLKTTPVLQSVASCYRSMLFSEDFSDVTFQCSDGVSIPAHKLILAASSPYFKAAFQGDWSENNSDGIWRTTHSSNMIKSVFTLIYTGSVEECENLMKDKGTNPLGLMDLACEYNIKALIHISIDGCKKTLQVSNARKMLQTAHLHSCGELKKACFEFIQKNSSKALMSPDMMSLATEDPGLWEELGEFLNGTSTNPNKRARTDGS